MTDALSDFDDVETVVADPLRFKLKLGIGEDAYATIRYGKSLQELWDIGGVAAAGAGFASSSTVATTFFGGGWLAALGLGTAVTPVGWVIGAAAASAGAYYGVTRLIAQFRGSRVQQIPEFINTPIDLLGISLFDFIATLAVKIAAIDGLIDPAEKSAISGYFVREWGYDPRYVETALDLIEENEGKLSLRETAAALATFQRENPDCNYAAMQKEIIGFLRETSEADGRLDEREELALERIEAVLSQAGGFSLLPSIGSALGTAAAAPMQLVSWAGSFLFRGTDDTPATEEVAKAIEAAIPIVWLLGKTGAGKSSLIRRLTGSTITEVGNGFAPCTRTSQRYDHPQDAPLLRFLDTRGLGEAGYDPAEDLAACEGHSHAVLVLARLDDPVQGEVAEALAAVLHRRPEVEVLLVHTAGDLIPDDTARARARAANAALFGKATGRTLPQVEVALAPAEAADAHDDAPDEGLEALIDHLSRMLPAAALLLASAEADTAEQCAFAAVRTRVLTYATAAGASDVLPVVGLASVPASQFAMLRDLALHYDAPWTRDTIGAFLGALGVGFAARFGAGFGARQLAKLVPVYGQTIGAAAAGTISFATTYALGRAAAMYLHQQATGTPASPEDLQKVYRDALRMAADAKK